MLSNLYNPAYPGKATLKLDVTQCLEFTYLKNNSLATQPVAYGVPTILTSYPSATLLKHSVVSLLQQYVAHPVPVKRLVGLFETPPPHLALLLEK